MDASIVIACDPTGTSLLWTDGTRTAVDVRAGVVEGSLDAIESRLAVRGRAKKAMPSTDRGEPVAAPAPAMGEGERESAPVEGETSSRTDLGLEGGVSVATTAEFWSGTASMGLGPRLDVGIGPRGPWVFIIAEGASFGLGSNGSSQIMLFDLQAGVAMGAPFKKRLGLGVVILGGGERLAASTSNGLWVWSATGSVGARASLPIGTLSMWLGLDGRFRSATLEAGGPSPVSVPQLSAMMSFGFMFPAFKQ